MTDFVFAYAVEATVLKTKLYPYDPNDEGSEHSAVMKAESAIKKLFAAYVIDFDEIVDARHVEAVTDAINGMTDWAFDSMMNKYGFDLHFIRVSTVEHGEIDG